MMELKESGKNGTVTGNSFQLEKVHNIQFNLKNYLHRNGVIATQNMQY